MPDFDVNSKSHQIQYTIATIALQTMLRRLTGMILREDSPLRCKLCEQFHASLHHTLSLPLDCKQVELKTERDVLVNNGKSSLNKKAS